MGQIASPKFYAVDSDGDPLVGGLLYTYEAGTDTPKETYSDPSLETENTNPVELDSRGEALVYGSGSYKLVLKDSDEVTIWTVDDVTIVGVSSVSDSDEDTIYQVEESADEDTHRWDCAGEEQMTLADGALAPSVDSDLDLGTSAKFFKDLYTDRVAIDATYYALMPTNGVGANAVFMLGNSSTVAWFYLNTAPPGWLALDTGKDTVLAVANTGSGGDYDVDGGNPDSTASWTIDGITAAAESSHTHAMATSGTLTDYDELSQEVVVDGGMLVVANGTGSNPAKDLVTDDTAGGSSHTHTVSSDGSYRPKASVGKLFQLDTAA